MENIKEKLTANKVMKQVDNCEYLKYDDAQIKEAINAIKNGIGNCNNIIEDLLEWDWESSAYYRNLKSELERYLKVLENHQKQIPFNGRIEPKRLDSLGLEGLEDELLEAAENQDKMSRATIWRLVIGATIILWLFILFAK
jgi:hypothetical protein